MLYVEYAGVGCSYFRKNMKRAKFKQNTYVICMKVLMKNSRLPNVFYEI